MLFKDKISFMLAMLLFEKYV